MLASISILMEVQVPRNGFHHHLYPQGSPRCLLLLWEALQDHQVGIIQSPFKLLPLHWDLEHVRFCLHFLRVESLFLTALCLFCMSVPLAFKARHSWASSFCCKTPGLRSLMSSSDPLLFGENLFHCDYPPICGSTPEVVGQHPKLWVRIQGCGS